MSHQNRYANSFDKTKNATVPKHTSMRVNGSSTVIKLTPEYISRDGHALNFMHTDSPGIRKMELQVLCLKKTKKIPETGYLIVPDAMTASKHTAIKADLMG